MSKWEPNHGPPLTTLEHKMHDLSNISVLEGPFTDSDSKLIYVFTNTVSQSVVPVKRLLSKRFVTALDDEEVGKLWILNTLTVNIEP